MKEGTEQRGAGEAVRGSAVPGRILIIKPSSLGDVATALPLACDLKTRFPEVRIDWLVHPAFAPLVEGHEAIRQVLLFDRRRLSGWWFKPKVTRELLGLVRTLAENRYDCVIDAQGLFRSGFLARASGAPMRIGFAQAREGATLFYTHRVKLPAGPQMAVVRMRALLGPLGIDPAGRPAEARVPVQAAAAAAVAAKLGNSVPVVVIPGARWATKQWSAEGYAAVIDRLMEAGQTPVLAGSAAEAGLCGTIARKCRRGPLNLAGATSLAELVAVLARAKLVVGNDSGPLHVAVALGRPVVGVYGPTDPRFVGPYGQLEHVVRHEVECQPCRRKHCGHHSCMAGIGVEAVWAKIVEVLGNTQRAN